MCDKVPCGCADGDNVFNAPEEISKPDAPENILEKVLGLADEESRTRFQEKMQEDAMFNRLARTLEDLWMREVVSHSHDWRPDGESWRSRTCDCDIKIAGDMLHHRKKNPDHIVRKRRYTCHCGATKTITLKENEN